MRIVSLVPSVTETLTAWGREPVACTRFCERPDLPHVGGTKDPDVAGIIELAPDLVVVDAEENRLADYERLVGAGLEVRALHVRSVAELNAAMASLAARVGGTWEPLVLDARRPARARAFIPIWRRPWIALGAPTYATSLLEHLGVANVCSSLGAYPSVSLDAARRAAPDVVLAPSEPYPFSPRQLAELESVAPTVFLDGRDLFWWGSRTRAALGRLDGVLAEL